MEKESLSAQFTSLPFIIPAMLEITYQLIDFYDFNSKKKEKNNIYNDEFDFFLNYYINIKPFQTKHLKSKSIFYPFQYNQFHK